MNVKKNENYIVSITMTHDSERGGNSGREYKEYVFY